MQKLWQILLIQWMEQPNLGYNDCLIWTLHSLDPRFRGDDGP